MVIISYCVHLKCYLVRPQTKVHFLRGEKETSSFVLSAKHLHSDNILTEMRERMHSIQRFVCVAHLRIMTCDTLEYHLIF